MISAQRTQSKILEQQIILGPKLQLGQSQMYCGEVWCLRKGKQLHLKGQTVTFRPENTVSPFSFPSELQDWVSLLYLYTVCVYIWLISGPEKM